MAASKMSPIEPLSVGGTKPLHSLFQIGSPGSDKKVVMIIHQHIGEYVNIKPLRHLADSIQETAAILLVDKNIAALVATR